MGDQKNKGAKASGLSLTTLASDAVVANLALASGLMMAGGILGNTVGTAIETAGQHALDNTEAKKTIAQSENAPKTAAALRQEEIKATSKIIRGRTVDGWGDVAAKTGIVGSGLTLAAILLAANKKEKSGEITDEPANQDIQR